MERREQHTQKTMCDRIDTQLFMSSRNSLGFQPGLNPELYTQFVCGNEASLVGVNEYRLPMLHCSLERRGIARGYAVKPLPRIHRGYASA